MDYAKFIAFAIGLLLLVYVVVKITNKLLKIEEVESVSDTPGARIYRWGRVIIFIGFLVSLWYMTGNNSNLLHMYFWMIYTTLLLGFGAVMEFIYIKESKQYISTVIGLIVVLIAIYCVYNNPFLN
ncbi:DUF4181 domain-containing protein [Paenibacillus physcomitrellae]|uniref:DUF4181 domain-containing protein n=1 Tax=Paenibacillus physcomitrellae TaxID=1619311 RepID=A0ABQ1GL30_9BACL|nr:DUF4181 domain-containing protein [Paenibacillus physcomitrellae]GGA46029.1 hypothetical protein GCM10010917_34140 [Paenibacillus physcomitrellae]